MSWLEIRRGDAPLIVSMPHTGTDISKDIEQRLVSPWLARKDADWWIEKLYDFAPGMGATVLRTTISRTVIDVNRDPSGRSLYPGQNTTELCPTTTFDGEPLYRDGMYPNKRVISNLIMPRSMPRSHGCAVCMEKSRCSRRIRSAPSCHVCSTASCRTLTSERTAVRVVQPNSPDLSRPFARVQTFRA